MGQIDQKPKTSREGQGRYQEALNKCKMSLLCALDRYTCCRVHLEEFLHLLWLAPGVCAPCASEPMDCTYCVLHLVWFALSMAHALSNSMARTCCGLHLVSCALALAVACTLYGSHHIWLLHLVWFALAVACTQYGLHSVWFLHSVGLALAVACTQYGCSFAISASHTKCKPQ